jgi:hypothetical protein
MVPSGGGVVDAPSMGHHSEIFNNNWKQRLRVDFVDLDKGRKD